MRKMRSWIGYFVPLSKAGIEILLLVSAVLLMNPTGAYSQAVFSVASAPVTTVSSNEYTARAGDIMLTILSGSSAAGYIAISYDTPITCPDSAVTVTGTGGLGGAILANLSNLAGALTIWVPPGGGVEDYITVDGVRLAVAPLSSGTSVYAHFDPTGGNTVNSAQLPVIMSGAPGLGSVGGVSGEIDATTGAVTVSPVVGATEGHSNAFDWSLSGNTTSVMVRFHVDQAPPPGVTVTFPAQAFASPSWGGTSLWQTANSEGTDLNLPVDITSSNLDVYYHAMPGIESAFTDTDPTAIETLSVPVTITVSSSALPLAPESVSYTASLAPIGPAFDSNDEVIPIPIPRFQAVEVGPATLFTVACTSVPTPVLTFLGAEDAVTCSYPYDPSSICTRYYLGVSNWQLFPAELFAPDGDSSRTWVRVCTGSPDYPDCSLQLLDSCSSPWCLSQIYFDVLSGTGPTPDNVLVALIDHGCPATGSSPGTGLDADEPYTTYWSNEVDISAAPDGYLPISELLNPDGSGGVYQLFEFDAPFGGKTFNFGILYPPADFEGTIYLVVQPILKTQEGLDELVQGTPFEEAQLVPYQGTGSPEDFGVLFRVTCEDSAHNPITCPLSGGVYKVKTSWDTMDSSINDPAYLKAPEGTKDWENIFTEYSATRFDPTGVGRTCCRISDFVFVQNVTLAAGQQAPSINITTPPDGSVYAINQAVAAAYSCEDPSSVVTSCLGPVPSGEPIDTSSSGSKSFEVSATVSSGPSVDLEVTYQVVGPFSYQVCPLYDQTKAVKKGSAVPIKLSVCDGTGGHNFSNPNMILRALRVQKDEGGTIVAPVPDPGDANPGGLFRFDSIMGDGGGYIYNLSTKDTAITKGTWTLYFQIEGAGSDLSEHFVHFKVK